VTTGVFLFFFFILLEMRGVQSFLIDSSTF
jgi:hypothetical protein